MLPIFKELSTHRRDTDMLPTNYNTMQDEMNTRGKVI